MSGVHPFDSFFQPIADRSFPEFEAEQSGELELEQFGRLPAVRAFLESAGVTLEDSPQVFEEYLTAVYVAYRFWRAGKPTSHASAELLAPPYVFSAVSVQAFPKQAIYLELPPQKFWAQVSPELPHEPLNGLFVVAEPKQSWLVMAVLGLHPVGTALVRFTFESPKRPYLRPERSSVIRRSPPRWTEAVRRGS